MNPCSRTCLILITALGQSWAGLAEFDAVVAQNEADRRIFPKAKLTSPVTLDGTGGVPFDFGSTLFDVTIEFIVSRDFRASNVSTLAVGREIPFELRFEQWNNLSRLGFTHLGTKDYVFNQTSPQQPTHVCFRWDDINPSGTIDIDEMEIYINGHLADTIKAPGFKMPKDDGFLGGRNATAGHAMTGRIDRVVVHNTALDPAIIKSHACAFLGMPYQSNYDPVAITYDAAIGDGNPVNQGWPQEEVTTPGADNDADGVLDGNANVGPVSGPAWQIYDRRPEAELDAPGYRHFIEQAELAALFENGWTFTAKVRAVAGDHATSSFAGWQFRQGSDPGYGIGSNAARVGFHFFESAAGEFVVSPTGQANLNLGPGSGDEVHTIKAVAQPRSPGFEWFVNDVSQGYLDIRDFPYGNDDSVLIGANSPASIGDGADWFEVTLESGGSISITPEDEQIAREVVPHDESIVADGVDAATGSFMRAHNLLTVQGVRTIDFPIHYDSRLTDRVGPLGYGWSHPYEARLKCYGDDQVMIHWDANRTSEFVFDRLNAQDHRTFAGADEDVRYAELVENVFEVKFIESFWRLTMLDGTTYGFDLGSGKLAYMANNAGQFLVMERDDAGRLIAIKDEPTAAKIRLKYNERGLISLVTDPLGREVLLDYDEAWRLTSIPSAFLLDEETDYVSREDVPFRDNDGVLIPIPVATGGVVGLAYLHDLPVYHERPSDLTFFLRSPQGTEVEIPHSETGPEFDLSGFFEQHAFDNELRQGNWHVRVVDSVPGVTGRLNGHITMRLSDASRAISLSYDGHRITSAVDALGDPLFSNVYDALGRVVSQDDGRAETPPTTFTYVNQGGGLTNTRVVDPLGCIFQFVHDDAYRLLSVTNPLGHVTAFTYDGNGNRTSRTDARGHTTQFTYDDVGNLTSVTDAAGHQTTFSSTSDRLVTEITDPLGRETSFQYLQKRLTAVTDALLHTDRKRYDDATGQVTSVQLHDNGDLRFNLNSNGMLGGVSGNGSSGAEQDAAGRLTASWIPGNSAFTERFDYTYTPVGDVLTVKNSEDAVTTHEYDHRGRRIRTIDAKGNATSFTYNGNNSLVSVTNPLGHVIRYEHDHLDRVTCVIDPRGQTTKYQYDVAGRQIAVTDPLGRTTRTEYDAVGNVVARFDATGTRVAYITYDNRNLPIRVEDALGHASTATYDKVGRKTTATDSLGRTTTYHYDDLDRPTGVTDPLGRRSTATYQSDDVINTLQGPGSGELEFTYNRSNRLTSIQRFSGNETRYTYYGAGDGKLNGMQREESHTRMHYDVVGRVQLNTVESGWFIGDMSRSYSYDLNGNLTAIGTRGEFGNFFTVVLSKEYDAANRLTSYTDELGNTLTYTYDANGNLTSLGYPDDWTVHYAYDAGDRLTTVTDGDGRVTTYSYNRRDQITQIAMANGTVRNMRYDRLGQLLYREDLDANGTLIVSYQYEYDSKGRIQSEHVEPDAGPVASGTRNMTFDQEYQLTSLNGVDIEYDRDGNMIKGPLSLRYNARNRLVSTGSHVFDYDEEDNLVGWGTTKFVVNPAGPLAQILTKTEADGTLTRYVWGIGLLYQETEGATETFHQDHVGSTVALSNAAGLTSGRVSYDPYGKITSRVGSTDTIFLFNGLFGVVTSPEGLNYMRFRWYWPDAGRFVNIDAHLGSVTNIASLNRMGYAGGNPILYVDPHGEFFNLIAGAIGAVAGAVVGAGAELIGAAVSGEAVDWGRVGAAAAGGAVAGGLAGLTAGASTAVTIGVAIGAGAAGGVTENLVGAAINGEAVDFGSVATSAGIGAAGGLAGFGAGKLIGKAGNRFSGTILKRIGSGGGKYRTFAREMFTPDRLLKRQAGKLGDFVRRSRIINGREFARDFLVDVGVSSAIASHTRPESITSPPGGGGRGGGGSTTIYRQAMNEINAGRERAYGEYIHYNTFLSALSLANRPIPNNPSNTLGGF